MTTPRLSINPLPEATTQEGRADRELQRAGRDFLFALYAALRALKLYPLENQTVQKALQELQQNAGRLLQREGAIVLRYVGDLCFINDLRLRIDLGNYATFGGVGRILRRHGIGQLEAEAGVALADWTGLLSLLGDDPDPLEPFEGFWERLQKSSVRHLQIGAVAESGNPQSQDREREVAKRAYAHSVSVAREVMTGVRMGKGVSLRRVKRAVQGIVDQVLNNEASIVGMTALRDFDEYTFVHSVNVCIFSVALGKKLNLSKRELYDLGLGALLHDIGKMRMPLEVINKAGKLTDEEWRVMREHPTEGLLTLFEMRGLTEFPLRAMLLAYEHHMKVDLTGYPRCTRPRDSYLFSRIVAVADAFDAATSKRSYQSEPWPPDQVLREMRDNPSRGFDPLLVKAFISMVGIYPVGSLVVLDSYELAVVIAANQRAGVLHLPVVRVVFDDMGLPLDPPVTLDLSEKDPATGRPLRSIIKTVDPERYGINVGDYIV